jgi:hypothetical protein
MSVFENFIISKENCKRVANKIVFRGFELDKGKGTVLIGSVLRDPEDENKYLDAPESKKDFNLDIEKLVATGDERILRVLTDLGSICDDIFDESLATDGFPL